MFSSIQKQQTAPPAEENSRLRILIVEDEPELVALLTIVLERIGCRPESAASCKGALQKAGSGTYDIILLDYFLPDGNGADLLARIRERQPEADIVTMTGENSREIELRCRTQHITYHLVKPFEIQELISLVNHVARRQAKARKCD